jgi:DNA-directed RNA polymerase specialized sigma24 family protein
MCEINKWMTKLETDLPAITDVAQQVGGQKLHNPNLVDDLVSDVHCKARAQYEKQIPHSPRAWARTASRRRAIDIGIRDERERNRQVPLHDHAELHDGNNGGPPEAIIREENEDVVLRVRAALLAARDELDEESRTLWTLRYEKRLTLNQICDNLNVNCDCMQDMITPRILGTRLAHLLDEWNGKVQAQLRNDLVCWELLGAQLKSRQTCKTWLIQVLKELGNLSVLV